MSQEFSTSDATAVVRTLQIICAAMMMGVLAFGAILVITAWQKVPAGNAPMIALFGAVFAVVLVVMRFVVPAIVIGSSRRQLVREIREGRIGGSREAAARLFGVYTTKSIIAMALLEGAAFFNLVAYQIDVRWWSLAVAGVLLFLMAAQFPTKNRLEYWVHDQLQLMEMDRVA